MGLAFLKALLSRGKSSGNLGMAFVLLVLSRGGSIEIQLIKDPVGVNPCYHLVIFGLAIYIYIFFFLLVLVVLGCGDLFMAYFSAILGITFVVLR